MVRVFYSSLIFISLLAFSASAQTPPVIVLEHATLIDGLSPEPHSDVTVVLRDGKIESIGRAPASVPSSAIRFDLSGRWLLPGLIDAHVHPFLGLESAHNMLASGVTTGRSMLVTYFTDVGLRALHRRGDADIPDILAAGYPVVPNLSGFRPSLEAVFFDFPELDDLRNKPDIGVDGVRRLVRANLAHNVDVIKIFATDRAGLLSSDPRKRLLSDGEMAAAVEEAHKAGVPVAAHAHGDEGAAAAVRAGVDTIEHGTYLSDATLTLMQARGVCFTPTISANAVEANGAAEGPAGGDSKARALAMLPRARDTARRAHLMRIRVIAGADTAYGSDDPHRIADEMEELVGVGFTPMEAIQAATSVSAQCIGISKRTGAIHPGLEADLVVMDSNPLKNISAVRDVVLVINDGRVAINHLTF